MKRLTAVGAGVLFVLLAAAPVNAGPPSGTTTLLDPPKTGTTMRVQVTIHTSAPVVPYEYAIQNECALPDKGGSTLQHDDIVAWTDVVDGDPATTMPIDLGTIPTGSKCKVFLMHGNVVIKGTATSYQVVT
jgi:hypothetical protein